MIIVPKFRALHERLKERCCFKYSVVIDVHACNHSSCGRKISDSDVGQNEGFPHWTNKCTYCRSDDLLSLFIFHFQRWQLTISMKKHHIYYVGNLTSTVIKFSQDEGRYEKWLTLRDRMHGNERLPGRAWSLCRHLPLTHRPEEYPLLAGNRCWHPTTPHRTAESVKDNRE